jgi:hypothetical protein
MRLLALRGLPERRDVREGAMVGVVGVPGGITERVMTKSLNGNDADSARENTETGNIK